MKEHACVEDCSVSVAVSYSLAILLDLPADECVCVCLLASQALIAENQPQHVLLLAQARTELYEGAGGSLGCEQEGTWEYL